MVKEKAHRAARKVAAVAPHAEHIGFVAYAGMEVAGLHWLLYLCSFWLLVTGIAVIIAGRLAP